MNTHTSKKEQAIESKKYSPDLSACAATTAMKIVVLEQKLVSFPDYMTVGRSLIWERDGHTLLVVGESQGGQECLHLPAPKTTTMFGPVTKPVN